MSKKDKQNGSTKAIAVTILVAVTILLSACSDDAVIESDDAVAARLKPVGEVEVAKTAVAAAPAAVAEAAPVETKEIAVAPVAAVVATTAPASDGGASLYTAKGCTACHGADAKSPIAPAYPSIAGQTKEYLNQQMKDIKSGARSNGQSAAMKGIMAGVSDAEIEILAEYLSGLGY